MPTLFNSTLFNFSSFIELALRYGCSPVNLLHAFKISFLKNTYGGLLLRVFFLLQQACQAVAVLLEYFYLVAFLWMGLEGLLLYFMLRRVFQSPKLFQHKLFHLLLWGRYLKYSKAAIKVYLEKYVDLKSWENIKKKDFDFENVCLNFLIVILFYHSQEDDRLNIEF